MHASAPAAPLEPTVGSIIDGRYKVLGRLGAGGMGSILLAEHLQFQRQVAIKVLTPSAEDAQARERFLIEARGVCHLQHPNLVTYHDFGIDPASGRLYLVIELLRGKDLSKVIAREQPIPLSRTVRIIGQLCDALTEAHSHGVVHRDLKPANIMLVRRGDDADFVKLIDFGIARASHLSGPELTGKNRIIGTTGYLAPEYIARQEVSPKVDLYAVGIIAYELIRGARPFVGDPQAVMMAHLGRAPAPLDELPDGRLVPPALNRVIQRALAKDPAERFDSATQLKGHLLSAARPLLDGGAADPTSDRPAVSESSTTSIEFAPVGEADPIAIGTKRATPPAPIGLTRRSRAPELTGAGTAPLRAPTVPVTRTGAAPHRRWTAAAIGLAAVAAAAAAWVWFGGTAPAPPVEKAPAPMATAPAPEVPRRDGEEPSLRLPERPLALAVPVATAPVSPGPAVDPAPAPAAPPPKPKAAPVAFTVVVIPFGDVYEAGRLIGKTRVTAPFTPGRHCVRVKHPLVEKSECFRVPAKPGGSVTIALALPP